MKIPRFIRITLRRFGYILLPISEIAKMESDSIYDYRYMKNPKLSPVDKGYFNGLADYASRKASDFKIRYM